MPPLIAYPPALSDSQADTIKDAWNGVGGSDLDGNAWTRASVKDHYANSAAKNKNAVYLSYLVFIAS